MPTITKPPAMKNVQSISAKRRFSVVSRYSPAVSAPRVLSLNAFRNCHLEATVL